jgi:autotransporter-associated beta strand protein
MRAHLLTTTAAVALLAAVPARAQDATWLLNPSSGDFNTAANWNPATVPTRTAFFGATNTPNLTLNSPFSIFTEIGGFTFNAGASNYTLANPTYSVTVNGAGIVINGGSATFNLGTPPTGSLAQAPFIFTNSSTAGSATINNEATSTLSFRDASTAGSATINNNGVVTFSGSGGAGATSTAGNANINNNPGGTVEFTTGSTAGSAIINNNTTVAAGGELRFFGTAGQAIINNTGIMFFLGVGNAGSAIINNTTTITNNGLPSNGLLTFADNSTAGSAAIVNNGILRFADSSGAGSATIINNQTVNFVDSSRADSATIINNGLVRIAGSSNPVGVGTSQSRWINGAAGVFDLSELSNAGAKAGSIEGAGTIALGSKNLQVGCPTIECSNSLSTTFAGVLKDGGEGGGTGGSLTKAGNGTLTLTGINTYTGPTTIDDGVLIVNGSIASSSLTTVAEGGTLGGTGTIGNTQVNEGGTFAPGNSPGTMTVQGNLAFQSGAFYLVQVNPATASSANVTGTASLAGTVQAAFAPGSYVTRQYTILHADQGVSGTFGSLSANAPANFNASLSYDANNVFLNLTAVLGLGAGPGDAQSLGAALNSFFNHGGALPSAFVTVFGLTGANLANALEQLSGEAATGAQKVGFQLTDQFLNLMLDPFVDGRSRVSGADHPALGFAPAHDNTPPEIALAYASVLKGPRAPAPVYEPRWTAWGGAYGGSNRTSGDLAVMGSHDLSARTAGVAGGVDYRFTPDTTVGFALAGGGSNWSLAQGLGGGKSDAFQAGLYGATKYGPAYLAAAFAFANHWMSTDRVALVDHLTADFNAQSYGGRLEGGYRFGTPFGGIAPYAAIQAQNFHTPGYTETGVIPNGFALTFNGRDATATRSELGARFDRVLAVYSNAVLALRGRLAWAHDWISDPTLTPLFQVLPGSTFIVNGAFPAKDSALASAGGELRLANGITLLAKFDGEFASHSSTYAGTGTIRYTW